MAKHDANRRCVGALSHVTGRSLRLTHCQYIEFVIGGDVVTSPQVITANDIIISARNQVNPLCDERFL